MLDSKSCGLLTGSKSIELHDPDDKRVGNKCNHFSIRAYVAEIREVDKKICWPFVVDDNHDKVEELADCLPPLCVTQFRWWGCKNCLQKTDTDEDTTEKMIQSCFKEKVKTNLTNIEGTTLEATLFSPEPVLHVPANEADMHDGNGIDENPNKITGRSNYGSTNIEPADKGNEISGKEKTMIDLEIDKASCMFSADEIENASEPIINDKNAFEVVVNELERSRSTAISEQEHHIHGVANWEFGFEIPSSICNGIADMESLQYGGSNLDQTMKEEDNLKVIGYEELPEIDLGIQNNGVGDVNLGPRNKVHPMISDDTSNGLSSRSCESLLNRRCDQNGDRNRATDAENSDSLREVGMLYSNGNFHRKRTQKMRMLSDILSSEIPSLPEKDHIPEGGAESEDIDAAIDLSKSASDALIRSDLDHGLKNHVADVQGLTKTNIRKKRTKMPRVENGEIPLICWLKDSSGKSSYESCVGFRKHQKVSKSISDHKTKKVQGSDQRKHEETTLDDVPMEIVELMAKFQHERLLWHSEKDNQIRDPSTETHRTKTSPKTMNFREVPQNEVSSFLLEDNTSKQKPRSSKNGGDVFTAGGCIRTLDKNLIARPFDVQRKCKSGTSCAKQFKQPFISKGAAAREKSPIKAKFPITGSNKNGVSHERKMVGNGWSETCLQSERYHMGQELSIQTSCTEPFLKSLKSKALFFGPNSDQKVVAKSCDGCMILNCSNPSQEPEGKLKTISYRNNSLKSVDPNIGPELQKWKGKVARTRRRAHRAFASFIPQRGIDHHVKKLWPSDLYAEDSISAMHLLRLMDQGAYSSTPINAYLGDNQAKFINQPHFSNDHHQHSLFGLDGNLIKSPTAFVDPVSFGSLEKDHHFGTSCELVPLLPKIDALGSSSQVGNSTDPCNWRSPTNFMGQYSAEVSDMKNKVVSSPKSHGEPKDNHEHLPVIYLKKIPYSASDSMNFFNQSQKRERSTGIQLEVNKRSGEEIQNMKQCCETEICAVNRNPAEINTPETESFYRVGFKYSNVRKLCPSSGRLTPEGRKRKRMMKLTAIRGHIRHCGVS